MINTPWLFIDELEGEYGLYRKMVMEKYALSAIEVDVILFLAYNSEIDLAADIAKMTRRQKSHISMAVKGLTEKGYLYSESDLHNQKKMHLKITENAEEIVEFGKGVQQSFIDLVYTGFTQEETACFSELCNRILQNIRSNHEKTGRGNDGAREFI